MLVSCELLNDIDNDIQPDVLRRLIALDAYNARVYQRGGEMIN
jgi:hypothetical protein